MSTLQRAGPDAARILELPVMTQHTVDDATLHRRLDALCAEGWEISERFERDVRDRHFHPFVPADYDVVRKALLELRGRGRTFLEWGSATGVITIMADMMGFDACGIEIDASLVETARGLAKRHGSNAQFAAATFLPTGYVWHAGDGDDRMGTLGDLAPSGYLELGRPLDDFDIVFGYPWGGESPIMFDVMKRYGRRGALFLMHDTNEGVRSFVDGKETTGGR